MRKIFLIVSIFWAGIAFAQTGANPSNQPKMVRVVIHGEPSRNPTVPGVWEFVGMEVGTQNTYVAITDDSTKMEEIIEEATDKGSVVISGLVLQPRHVTSIKKTYEDYCRDITDELKKELAKAATSPPAVIDSLHAEQATAESEIAFYTTWLNELSQLQGTNCIYISNVEKTKAPAKQSGSTQGKVGK